MKPAKTFLAVAVLAAMQLAAAQQVYFSAPANSSQANIWIEKSQPKLITPFNENIPTQTGKVVRYGRMSPQPWAQAVNWHSGATISERVNAEIHESQLHLLTIRF